MKLLLQGSSIVLKIHVVHANVTKSIPLELSAPIFAICEHIRNAIREAEPEPNREGKDYGLFLPHEMSRNGLWLDNSKQLAQYILKQGDMLEYRYKFRSLTIQSQDEARKTLYVDDSWTVAELMIAICAKMGILNHEEYSLMLPTSESTNNATRAKSPPATELPNAANRDNDKLQKMKKKLQTDDDLNWLNPSQSLRQQSIPESEVLLLQRKYYFSDMNIDTQDPIQLNLLFIQLQKDIINGKHPVSMEDAEKLAAMQLQADLGDISASLINKKKLPIKLKECLPKDYVKIKSIDKRILKLYEDVRGLDQDEARRQYCSLCRSLKTYGITFFLVKEHVRGKNKLIPRLLGVSRDKVLRIDERTKEILKSWPLTSIKRWAGSYNAFTMDFGEYSPNEYYTAQTDKGEQISQLIAGYIDIIMRHRKSEEPRQPELNEESSLMEMNIEPNKAEIVELQNGFDDLVPNDSASPVVIAAATDYRESQGMVSMVSPTEELNEIYQTRHTARNLVSEGRHQRQNIEHDVRCSLLSGPSTEAGDYSVATPVLADAYLLSNNTNTDTITTTTTTTQRRHVTTGFDAVNRQHHNNNNHNIHNNIHNKNTKHYVPDSFMTGGSLISHTVHRFNSAQRSLIETINRDLQSIDDNKKLLDIPLHMEKINSKETKETIRSISKEHVLHNLGNMNTEVVQVIRSSKHAPLTSDASDSTGKADGGKSAAISGSSSQVHSQERSGSRNHQLRELERSFKVITVHMPSFVHNVRTIADLAEDQYDDEMQRQLDVEGNDLLGQETVADTIADRASLVSGTDTNLIDAAKKLADAFSGMLLAVKPEEEKKQMDMRKAILDAANKVGEASSELFRQITSPQRFQEQGQSKSRLGQLLNHSDQEYEDTLIYLVRCVANETAQMVSIIKQLTNHNQDTLLSQLIGPVTHAGLATSQLVTCVKILSATINQSSCTNQVLSEIEQVHTTIDVVHRQFLDVIGQLQLHNQHTQAQHVIDTGLESALDSINAALERLQQHLIAGVSVINFAPRIQNLESFIHSCNQMSGLTSRLNRPAIKVGSVSHSAVTSPKGPQQSQSDLVECLEFLWEMSDKVADDLALLADSTTDSPPETTTDGTNDDGISRVELVFRQNRTQLQHMSQNLVLGSNATWYEFDYELSNLLNCVLYEEPTQYICHDQLIHNLYRSTQILLTSCHKLVMSYRELSQYQTQREDQMSQLVEQSETVLVLMNCVKLNPHDDMRIAQFIRETSLLLKVVLNSGLVDLAVQHKHQHQSESGEMSLLQDIITNSANQTLAQCEHVQMCLETLEPLRHHLEMTGIIEVLIGSSSRHGVATDSNRPFIMLSNYMQQGNTPLRINMGQLIQISIALLTKLKSIVAQTNWPHYSAIFELSNDLVSSVGVCSENSLLVSLYQNICRMKSTDSSDTTRDNNDDDDASCVDDDSRVSQVVWTHSQQLEFKNVLVLLYRLISHADRMLTSHGQYSLDQYPLSKCIDELISTLSSLQTGSSNIFDRLKSSILHNQHSFKMMLNNNSTVSPTALATQLETTTICSVERSIDTIKLFKQLADQPLPSNASRCDGYLEQLYSAYQDVTRLTQDTINATARSEFSGVDGAGHFSAAARVIDDYIGVSVALLNLVQQMETDPKDTQRREYKSRLVCNEATQLMQSLTECISHGYGLVSESLGKLHQAKQQLIELNKVCVADCVWERKSFKKILNSHEMININCAILQETITERKSIAIDTQLNEIAQWVLQMCYTLFNLPAIPSRLSIVLKLLDLTINLITETSQLIKNDSSSSSSHSTATQFHKTKDGLVETLDYIVNCSRQMIPGYQECCSCLVTIAQLSHDLNEFEFSLASQSSSRSDNNVMHKSEATTRTEHSLHHKECVYQLGVCVVQIHRWLHTNTSSGSGSGISNSSSVYNREIDQSINQLGQLTKQHIEWLKSNWSNTNTASSVLSNQSYRLSLELSNQLVDKIDSYLQLIKHTLYNIENDSAECLIASCVVISAVLDVLQNIDDASAAQLITYIQSSQYPELLSNIHSATKSIVPSNQAVQSNDSNNNNLVDTVSGLITDDNDNTTIILASASANRSRFFALTSVPPVANSLINNDDNSTTPQFNLSFSNTGKHIDLNWHQSPLFRDMIEKTSNALLCDTKSLVENAQGSQRQLVESTETVIRTISSFADDFSANDSSTITNLSGNYGTTGVGFGTTRNTLMGSDLSDSIKAMQKTMSDIMDNRLLDNDDTSNLDGTTRLTLTNFQMDSQNLHGNNSLHNNSTQSKPIQLTGFHQSDLDATKTIQFGGQSLSRETQQPIGSSYISKSQSSISNSRPINSRFDNQSESSMPNRRPVSSRLDNQSQSNISNNYIKHSLIDDLSGHLQSVYALTSELNTMPLLQLLSSSPDQASSVAGNIRHQCLDTLVDYNDCVDQISRKYNAMKASLRNSTSSPHDNDADDTQLDDVTAQLTNSNSEEIKFVLPLAQNIQLKYQSVLDCLNMIEHKQSNIPMDVADLPRNLQDIHNAIKSLLNLIGSSGTTISINSQDSGKPRRVSFRDQSCEDNEDYEDEEYEDEGIIKSRNY